MSDSGSISQQILTNLGGGSGIDIFKLARDLADVETEPKKLALEASIEKTEASVSSYAAITYQIGVIKTAFQSLDDVDELAKNESISSSPNEIDFTNISGSARKANYDVSVSQLATSQRTLSNVYDSASQSLADSSFNLSIDIGSSSIANHTVAVATATPQGVVDAINSANLGISASLVELGNTAGQYRVILEGSEGKEGAFSISSTPALGFSLAENTLRESQNALLAFNGLSVERTSNSIDDLIEGASFQLKAVSSGSVNLSISRGEDLLKSSVKNMISAYNDMNGMLDALTDPDSSIENGGALSSDYTGVRYVEQQLRDALFSDSPTASGSITSFRDIGLSVEKDGQLVLDELKFDQAVASNYQDVTKMLTANTNNQTEFSGADKGLALNVITKLDALLENNGVLSDRSENAKKAVVEYQADLATLEARMEAVYERYLAQFSAMESLVRQMNSTRDYLKDQFEMMANVGKD